MNRTFLASVVAVAVVTFGLTVAPVFAAVAAAPPPAPAIAWSVQASGATGNDGRSSFAYAVNPGTEITDYVAVSNRGTARQHYNVYGSDGVNQFDTGAFGLLSAAQKPTDVGSWITMKVAEITIEPGQSAIIPFTILVPSDASPGDHTGGVIASVTTAAPGKVSGVGIDQRVATRVYLRVSGQPVSHVAAAGVVTAFTPAWNPFGGGDATVDYTLNNSGNVREDIAQTVTLSGPFGIQLAQVKGTSVRNLLPGQRTHVHQTISGVIPLLLLFADIKLTPSAPTDLVGQSKLRDQAGNLLPVMSEPKFIAIQTTAQTVAISWTLLLTIGALIALILLVSRYVRTTREQLFDAIDAATEQARSEALNQPLQSSGEKALIGVQGSAR